MTPTSLLRCPLCNNSASTLYHQDRYRSYRLCGECSLVFVPPAERPDIIAEKSEYDKHENHGDDEGYRTFLSRLAGPLLEKIPAGSLGLDFGSGPGPLLASMLREAGMRVRTYDVFYDPDASVWYQEYDFITCTEVVEHLHNPDREFKRLFAALKPGGWLGIMTKRVTDQTAFSRWHYIRDLTHVCFYSETTLRWVAEQYGASLELPAEDVALLQKRD